MIDRLGSLKAQLTLLAAAGFGSSLGALSRWVIYSAIPSQPDMLSIWATLLANISGSLIIGLMVALGIAGSRLMRPVVRQFVMVGFCGGLTTFSALSLETLLLVKKGLLASAAFYGVLTPMLAVASIFVGWRLGKHLSSASRPELRS